MDGEERTRWTFGGRYYATTLASDVATRDGIGLELDDVPPAPGRGMLYEVFQDNTTAEVTFTAFSTEPVPFELIEQFVAEARRRVVRD